MNDTLIILQKGSNAKAVFSSVFKRAKTSIVIEDEDDFLDDLSTHLATDHGLTTDDAEEYSRLIYGIWEDCGCSLTAFDRLMAKYKKELFNT